MDLLCLYSISSLFLYCFYGYVGLYLIHVILLLSTYLLLIWVVYFSPDVFHLSSSGRMFQRVTPPPWLLLVENHYEDALVSIDKVISFTGSPCA